MIVRELLYFSGRFTSNPGAARLLCARRLGRLPHLRLNPLKDQVGRRKWKIQIETLAQL